MKNFLFIFCLSIFTVSCTQLDEVVTKKNTKITHIQTYSKCKACKLYLESSLPGKKGIEFAELDLKKETLMIKYNQTEVSINDIKKYISGKGFWADEMKPDTTLERQLPTCCVKPREHK